jgi:hypothetical protein
VKTANSPILSSLPDPQTIRNRLSELATEANNLRSLLRLVERQRESEHGAAQHCQRGGTPRG